MRFLTKCQGSGVFDGLTKTAGVWVNSEARVVGGVWKVLGRLGMVGSYVGWCVGKVGEVVKWSEGDVFFVLLDHVGICWVQNCVMRQGIELVEEDEDVKI